MKLHDIKNVVVTGCSFMEGGSLTKTHNSALDNFLTPAEQLQFRFSKILSDMFDAKEINIASAGGSNERGIRKIYEWCEANSEQVKNSIFVFGLTELLRKEKYCGNTKSYIKWRNTIFFNNTDGLDNEGINHKLIPGSFEFVNYVKENNLYSLLLSYAKGDILLFTDLNYEFKTLSRQLDLLNCYIESKGGKLVVIAAMLEIDDFVAEEFGIKGELAKNKFNFLTFPGGVKCWKSYIKSYDPYYSRSRHPSIQDDKILAELTYTYVESIL